MRIPVIETFNGLRGVCRHVQSMLVIIETESTNADAEMAGTTMADRLR
jgi:hypothetical protein